MPFESPRRALCCPSCAAVLTTALAPVPDDRLVLREGWSPWAPQGLYALADSRAHAMVDSPGAFPVHVHPHDLVTSQLVPSGFGCCGYAPRGGANLHCRCGAPVGFFVDECSCRIEARLGAHWVDAPPAPPIEGIGARLDRLRIRGPVSELVHAGTSWEDERIADAVRPRDFAVQLDLAGEGLRFVIDGEPLALAWPTGELERAVGLRQLPVGNDRLALAYTVRNEELRDVSSWCLTRRADEVQLAVHVDGTTRAWHVWNEWLAHAFEEAVDAWTSRPV